MDFVIPYAFRLVPMLMLLAATIYPLSAQTAFAPITPENVMQITQIERIGNGVVRALAFSPDGSRLAAATALGVWVIEANSDPGMTLLDGQGGAESVNFSPDGSMIAAGGEDNSVMVW